jgi:hypothetical protein
MPSFGIIPLLKLVSTLGGKNKGVHVKRMIVVSGLPRLNVSVTLSRAKQRGLVENVYWGYWKLTLDGNKLVASLANGDKNADMS